MVFCDKEVTIAGATHDEDIVGVSHTVPEMFYKGKQSLSPCEIHGQNTQMVSNMFKFAQSGSISGKKQFLNNYWIHCKSDSSICFGGKQLCCYLIPCR